MAREAHIAREAHSTGGQLFAKVHREGNFEAVA